MVPPWGPLYILREVETRNRHGPQVFYMVPRCSTWSPGVLHGPQVFSSHNRRPGMRCFQCVCVGEREGLRQRGDLQFHGFSGERREIGRDFPPKDICLLTYVLDIALSNYFCHVLYLSLRVSKRTYIFYDSNICVFNQQYIIFEGLNV